METHFIDSSGLISWDMFKHEADYAFADCDFSGTTAEEITTLMGIFQARRTEVYITDYQHLGVYACNSLVPGMSDIYPAEDLLLANNAIAIDLRATLCQLPSSRWPLARYLALIEQIDALSLDDFARVRELLGLLATGRDNGWFALLMGELKAMLALAGGAAPMNRRCCEPNGREISTHRCSVQSGIIITATCIHCCN